VKVKGGTEHHAETTTNVDGDVTMTFKIDISGCTSIPEQDRLECIKAITESLEGIKDIAEILLCEGSIEDGTGGKSPNPHLTCRKLDSLED